MEILRVMMRWTGFNGAPGYSAFHFAGGGGLISDAQQVATRVASGMFILRPALPASVQIAVESEVTRLDSDTGEILGFHAIDELDDYSGQGTEGYSAASGGVINWRTDDVRFGRRIRGRTFIVPLSGESYESDGSLTSSALGTLRNFADEIVGGDIDSEFGVWSRPRAGTGGVFATATGYHVPDMSAVLRSRRD